MGRENCFISEITTAELTYGAENSKNPTESHNAVSDFISSLSVMPILGSIRLYAKEKVHLKRIGKPIHDDFDILLGVTSIMHNLILVTDNKKDFERLENIKLENWFARDSNKLK